MKLTKLFQYIKEQLNINTNHSNFFIIIIKKEFWKNCWKNKKLLD